MDYKDNYYVMTIISFFVLIVSRVLLIISPETIVGYVPSSNFIWVWIELICIGVLMYFTLNRKETLTSSLLKIALIIIYYIQLVSYFNFSLTKLIPTIALSLIGAVSLFGYEGSIILYIIILIVNLLYSLNTVFEKKKIRHIKLVQEKYYKSIKICLIILVCILAKDVFLCTVQEYNILIRNTFIGGPVNLFFIINIMGNLKRSINENEEKICILRETGEYACYVNMFKNKISAKTTIIDNQIIIDYENDDELENIINELGLTKENM